MVTGSIGLLPSASIGDTAPGLYEPIHGSAPDIAGQDKANPIATILSVAMMFRYSFHLAAEADAVEAAVVRGTGRRLAHPRHRRAGRHPHRHPKDGRTHLPSYWMKTGQPKGCPVSCVCPLHMVYWLYLVTERGTNQ